MSTKSKSRPAIEDRVKFSQMLPDGTSRPMTDEDRLAFACRLTLIMAPAKLKTYPSIKQLDKQRDMLHKRWLALFDALDAIDRRWPDRLEAGDVLVRQIWQKMEEVDRASQQLSDLGWERLQYERAIEFAQFVVDEWVKSFDRA